MQQHDLTPAIPQSISYVFHEFLKEYYIIFGHRRLYKYQVL